VAELEKEVEKQKELRIMYRKRMERTHDYLRLCLQIAQDKGFLDIILNHNKDLINLTTPTPPLTNSPPPPPAYDLLQLTNQAKINGWYIDPNQLQLGKRIAQGSTADIYRGVWRGLDVAVKCLFPDFFHSNDNGVGFFAQEVETLSKQRHCFVLQFMGACFHPPNQAWIVSELLDTTLKEWLHGNGNKRKIEREIPIPPLKDRITRGLEISQAMQYLHEQNPKVVHRDLKPSNIYMDDSKHVRVADFGHARFLSDDEKALTGETGTYIYMAPEVIRCEPYDEKCDVYSFGIIFNELLTGDHPYIETDYGPAKIAMEVAENKLRPVLAEDNGGEVVGLGELVHLIGLAWDEDPYIRPSFATITATLKKIRYNFVHSTIDHVGS
jgi:serine/threonine-protein kinase TNNI3K